MSAAIAASAEQAALLGLGRRVPLLEVRRHVFDAEGVPLESYDTYRGDAFAITIQSQVAAARARASRSRSGQYGPALPALTRRTHAQAFARSRSISSSTVPAWPSAIVIPRPEVTSTTRAPANGALTTKWSPAVARWPSARRVDADPAFADLERVGAEQPPRLVEQQLVSRSSPNGVGGVAVGVRVADDQVAVRQLGHDQVDPGLEELRALLRSRRSRTRSASGCAVNAG